MTSSPVNASSISTAGGRSAAPHDLVADAEPVEHRGTRSARAGCRSRWRRTPARLRARAPRKPWRASASAVVKPAEPAADDQDGSAVRLQRAASARKARLRRLDADPLDFPFELDAGILLARAGARFRPASRCRPRVAPPRLIRKLQCSSDTCAPPTLEPAAAGGVDQLPGLVAGRVLEGRAAGAALDRLRRLARFGDLVHLGGDGGRIAGRALEQRLR